MALLNFQKRFTPHIEAGDKTHTIRADRKLPIRVGETLHLYTGLRQKGARLLMRVPCTRVQQIKIFELCEVAVVVIDGEQLAPDEMQTLAIRDGFDGWESMLAFWDGRLPLSGQIIHWRFGGGAA